MGSTESKLASFCLLGLVIVTSSCGPDSDSGEMLCDPDVSGVTMDVYVSPNVDDSIEARAKITYSDLPCDGDSMTINGVEAPLQYISDDKYFMITFDVEAEDREYEFEFFRPGRDEPVVAHVTLPEDFELTSPAKGSEVSLEDGWELVWGPPRPGTIEIDFSDYTANEEPVCFSFQSEVVDDSGFYQVPGGAFSIDEDVWEPELCELLIVLGRTNDGDYPSEFAPGVIRAHRSSSVAVRPIIVP